MQCLYIHICINSFDKYFSSFNVTSYNASDSAYTVQNKAYFPITSDICIYTYNYCIRITLLSFFVTVSLMRYILKREIVRHDDALTQPHAYSYSVVHILDLFILFNLSFYIDNDELMSDGVSTMKFY